MKIISLIVIMLVSSVLFAQDVEQFGVVNEELPVGLNVGDTIKDMTLIFLNEKKKSLYELSSNRPTVVLFYRGEWCPVCHRYLSNLTDSLELISAKANVIVISSEKKENMEKMAEEHPQYRYVLDEDEEIMISFDVLFKVTKKYQKKIKSFLATDIAKHNGSDEAKLPVPATFIVDANGVITYKHFDYNYKIRASAKEILQALEE